MITRDEIIKMAREAGINGPAPARQGFKMYANPQRLERFAAIIERHLIASGYRKCAVGQRTTQFCGQLEQAVLAEREACAKVCESEAMRCEAAVERAEPDEVAAIRSTAWKISVCAAAIRARGEK